MIRGYVRVSTIEQGEGTSPETQRRQIEGYATMKGEPLLVDEDIGVSGSIPLGNRVGGAQLLYSAQPGDTIVAAKLDRLFRNAHDALRTAEQLKANGIGLVLLDLGLEPVTSGGVGKLVFTMMAAFAEMERERIRERTELGRRAKLERGGALGGHAPFGWEKVGRGKDAKLVPIPAEQEAIGTIYQGREAGLSLRSIKELVKMTHNLDISHEAVRRVLRDNGNV